MMHSVVQPTLERFEIRAQMSRVYPCVARPGYAWQPNYSAYVEQVRLTAGKGLAESDTRNLPLQISTSSKAEFRRIAKMFAPNATVIFS